MPKNTDTDIHGTVIIPKEDLLGFLHFEKYLDRRKWWKFDKNGEWIEIKCECEHVITLNDLEITLKNIIEKAPSCWHYVDWATTLYCALDEYLFPGETENPEDYFQRNTLDSKERLAGAIYRWLTAISQSAAKFSNNPFVLLDVEPFRRVLADINTFRRGEPVYAWRWSDDGKRNFLRNMDMDQLDRYDEFLQKEYVSLVRELAEKNDPFGLEKMGYSYYGGNALFPCDWEKSRDCFLKLLDKESVSDLEKAFYANTLGHIFYYGRCSGGDPEYEKALKYFKIGASWYVYESIYKLSDMYAYGYGTPVNHLAARSMIQSVYPENLHLILKEDYRSKFADLALRKGNLCRDGIQSGDEYYYYTLADFAIRKRMEAADYHGDSAVYGIIQRELRRIRADRPLCRKKTIYDQTPALLQRALAGYACRFRIRKTGQGLSFHAERIQRSSEKPEKFFVCFPDYGYCRLEDRITVTAVSGQIDAWQDAEYDDDSGDFLLAEFIADQLVPESSYGEYQYYQFYHHREPVAEFRCKCFRYQLKQSGQPENAGAVHAGNKGATGSAPDCSYTEGRSTDSSEAAACGAGRRSTEIRLATVCFAPGGKGYDYLAGDLDLRVGDRVIVHANGEDKEVEVIDIYTANISELPLDLRKYKVISRKV